jgi:CheY-like chemotaxis protein
VLRTLAADAGVPALDLDRITIDLSALAYVPRDVAVRNLLLPVLADDERIVLAMADPGQRRILEEVEFVTGRRLVPHVAMHAQLRRYIDTCYRARLAGERVYAAPDAAPLGALDAGRVSGEPRAPEPAGPGPVDLLEDESGLRPIDLDSQPLAPAAARARQTPVPGEPRRKKVLVVDDESDIRMLISRVLRDRGYEVVEAAHGADALRAVQNLVPDLLVLDAMLPEIHGFDVCRRIKRSPRYAHIPVIMISAVYRGWRFASDLRTSYGVDAFLEKPFKIADLADRVGELLSGTPREQAAPSRDLSAAAQAELAAGIRCCREGDIDGAIRHVKAGLDADPLSAQLHYQLGVLHGKQGKVYQAIHEMEQALEIEPGDFATLRNLGQLYEHAGFRCKAVEMWERAASASTDEVARSSIKEHLLKLL